MKLSVLALDYDGTIAQDGRLDVAVAATLSEVRKRGITVVVVSGRRLEDLRKASGSLQWADAFVVENGAAVAFPGHDLFLLCPKVSPRFSRALEAGHIPFRVGTCVVEADAAYAGAVLDIVRTLELPLSLHFNRDRLMVLPHGVCKSTGLREVLRAFRLSAHNALAIGDAENDHDLLCACEVGAAVAWGSEALRAAADDLVPGTGPQDVAAYVRRMLGSIRLPAVRNVRRRVTLGRANDGHSVELAVRRSNVLVAGEPRSGKSWTVGLLCEQLIVLGYSLCIVDPEGDYAPLEALPGVAVFGGAYPLPSPHEAVRALRHPDLSVVVELSRAAQPAKDAYLRDLLPELTRFRRSSGLPHRIVIDEAHYFLNRPDARDFVDFELGGYALVSYRVSDLHPDVLATMEGIIVTHTSDPRELAVIARIAGGQDGELRVLVGNLAINEAVVVTGTHTPAAHVERFWLAPRLTAHVRHCAKYRDVPLAAERAFVFTQRGRAWGAPARTLHSFLDSVARAPDEALWDHAGRGDFSRWIADVFGDPPLAADLRDLEHRHRTGEVFDLRSSVIEAVSLHYDVPDPAAPGVGFEIHTASGSPRIARGTTERCHRATALRSVSYRVLPAWP